MQPIQTLFKRNYRVLTFPLHEGICRHTVLKPCQTQNNNKQIPFLYNLEISEYTHTLRTKQVPSSTMDVRGANTFLLHNRLPIPCFLVVDRLICFCGVLSIFSRSFWNK